jgi:hypothetical protein
MAEWSVTGFGHERHDGGKREERLQVIVDAFREESVLIEKHDANFRRVGMAGCNATNRP